MKSFSPAGMATKGLYGYSRDRTTGAPVPGANGSGGGAQTFGNPDGATKGGGAYARGGASPNGPNQGGGSGGSGQTLNVSIAQDWLGASAGQNPGVHLSDLLTPTQAANFQAGVYSTVNISGSGSPVRGYWVVAGNSDSFEAPGFAFDLDPGIPITVNVDSSIVRFYGSGGNGGPGNGTGGFPGGNAFEVFFPLANALTLNITNTVGGNSGRFFGGGGGGGGGNVAFGTNTGGGGASGWFPGISPAPTGVGGFQGTDGGIYDPGNGGIADPNVAGGIGGDSGNLGAAGDGGALGQDGTGGSTGPGDVGGKAVARNGTPGVTNILTGNDPAFIRGTVE